MNDSCRIRVLGRELQVRSSAAPERVREIEAFVNEAVARVEARVTGGDRLSVAILTLMTLAEEHLALAGTTGGRDATGQLTQLIRSIEDVLPVSADPDGLPGRRD